jgi:hypothetical protein
VDINSAWETMRENIKMSANDSLCYYELRKHKPWFDEGCSKLVDKRKQAKLYLLQEPSEINGDNQNNVKHEAHRHLSNKKMEYLKKTKLMSLQQTVRTITSGTLWGKKPI